MDFQKGDAAELKLRLQHLFFLHRKLPPMQDQTSMGYWPVKQAVQRGREFTIWGRALAGM